MRPLSYSAIQSYQNCPFYYKLTYIDKYETTPRHYFSFGKSLHSALQFFYQGRIKPPTPEELLQSLDEGWLSEGYASPEQEAEYYQAAREILKDFQRLHSVDFRAAFAVESRFNIPIAGVPFTGFIDRIDKLENGKLRILDYKSGVNPFTLDYVAKDKQLTLYQIACEELYGLSVESLSLYHLRSQTLFASPARDEAAKKEVSKLVVATAAAIDAENFSPKENAYCPCEFGRLCPLYKHRYPATEPEEEEEIDIVSVVDEFVALKEQMSAADQRIEELKPLIHTYCEKHGLQRVFGSGDTAITRASSQSTVYDEETVAPLLKESGLWEEVSVLSKSKLNALIEEGALKKGLLAKIEAASTVKENYQLRQKSFADNELD